MLVKGPRQGLEQTPFTDRSHLLSFLFFLLSSPPFPLTSLSFSLLSHSLIPLLSSLSFSLPPSILLNSFEIYGRARQCGGTLQSILDLSSSQTSASFPARRNGLGTARGGGHLRLNLVGSWHSEISKGKEP